MHLRICFTSVWDWVTRFLDTLVVVAGLQRVRTTCSGDLPWARPSGTRAAVWREPDIAGQVEQPWTPKQRTHKNVIQWGSEIGPFEIWKHLKTRLFKGWISNGRALAMEIVPTPWKLDFKILKIRTVLSGFQMVGLLHSRSHSKSGSFATQPLFGH